MWQAMIEWFNGLHFLYPGWLWTWPVALMAVGLLIKVNRLRSLAQLPEISGSRAYRHPRLSLLRQLHIQVSGHKTRRGIFSRWVQYALVLLCVHVALAHPYRLGQQFPAPAEYRDTIFVIDTSISMLLRDYLVAGERTDRVTILKSVLNHFVEQLSGNRIGLIAFSEQAYTLVPLTADYALLKARVRHLEPATLTGRTSNVGKALLYTLQQYSLQQAPQAKSSKQAHKPVLVLITDVNRSDREIDPRAVADYLQQQGYPLYTIGIGASSEEAQQQGYANLLYQPTNFSLLEAIAERGGGRFYWASNVDNLQEAVKAIQSAERMQVNAEPRYVMIPLYQWPLLATLFYLVLMSVFRLWRPRNRLSDLKTSLLEQGNHAG